MHVRARIHTCEPLKKFKQMKKTTRKLYSSRVLVLVIDHTKLDYWIFQMVIIGRNIRSEKCGCNRECVWVCARWFSIELNLSFYYFWSWWNIERKKRKGLKLIRILKYTKSELRSNRIKKTHKVNDWINQKN